MALEILRRQALSSAPGSTDKLVFETMKDVIASFDIFPSDESLGIICAALPCLVATWLKSFVIGSQLDSLLSPPFHSSEILSS